MWIGERQRRILNLIATVGRIEAEAMAEQLRVSRETIRRDLKQLEQDGRIRRVHGGAVPPEPLPERPFRARRRVEVEAKRRIGLAAAPLLKPGQSCFVDAGTTTAAFSSALARVGGICVITNSVEVAATMRAADPRADVVLLGGQFGTEVPATHGELTISEIGRFRADFAVLSPVGIDPAGGITYHSFAEAEIARTMMAHATATIWLADRTKLGQINRATVCHCRDVGTLVTDAPAETTAIYRAAGVARIVTAEAEA